MCVSFSINKYFLVYYSVFNFVFTSTSMIWVKNCKFDVDSACMNTFRTATVLVIQLASNHVSLLVLVKNLQILVLNNNLHWQVCKFERRRRRGRRPIDVEKVMIWHEYEAYLLQVKQIGTSACGPTAVLTVLVSIMIFDAM